MPSVFGFLPSTHAISFQGEFQSGFQENIYRDLKLEMRNILGSFTPSYAVVSQDIFQNFSCRNFHWKTSHFWPLLSTTREHNRETNSKHYCWGNYNLIWLWNFACGNVTNVQKNKIDKKYSVMSYLQHVKQGSSLTRQNKMDGSQRLPGRLSIILTWMEANGCLEGWTPMYLEIFQIFHPVCLLSGSLEVEITISLQGPFSSFSGAFDHITWFSLKGLFKDIFCRLDPSA